ncbi:hypothetical protein KR222_004485, partial [Zaprionus bogoriensis]
KMGLNSICKLNPDSAACNHLQREVCGQCPRWNLNQDQEPGLISSGSSSNPAHKLMTNAECERLKRDLQISFFSANGGANPLIFMILVVFILLCMVITFWLLAKAFVFKKPQREEDCDNSQDRQLGGQSSVEDIVQKLRDKCKSSTQRLESVSKNEDEIYVPSRFWQKFPLHEPTKKSSRAHKKTEATAEQRNEPFANTSEESSDSESTETSLIEEINENEDKATTTSGESSSSTDELSERTTDDEEPTKDCRPDARKSTDSLGEMPTYYGQSAMGAASNQNRGKIRWANWLKRSKPDDFQV